MNPISIHPDTTVGPVDLTVNNLERSALFYHDVLGFNQLHHQGNTLTLTADGATPLLVLHGNPDAPPRPPRTTGLYHFAILLPSRADLGRTLYRLAEMGWPLSGASDHLVSEALYLDDPDGNGIEIYRDRPRNTWPRLNGEIQMTTKPLDLNDLLAERDRDSQFWNGLPAGTVIGHIHLHVADLRQAETFYHGLLGFDIMQHYGRSALFLSAGGYHHHIGLNTWAGLGAPPPPSDAIGLRHFAIVLPNRTELERVTDRVQQAGTPIEPTAAGSLIHDPFQNGIVLTQQADSQSNVDAPSP